MNRRAMLFFLALLFASSSALAYEEARLSPAGLVLRVGEAADVEVGVHHLSGLNYTMWRFVFNADREDVVTLDGTLDYAHPVWSGAIHVMALAPGTAQIMSGGKVYGTVEVVCGLIQPAQAIAPVITAKRGETVKLAVTSTTEAFRVIQWYDGRIGDHSHPLAASGVDLALTPAEAGTRYVWASSKSPCSSSAAEFRIDVLSPRRRAVGR